MHGIHTYIHVKPDDDDDVCQKQKVNDFKSKKTKKDNNNNKQTSNKSFFCLVVKLSLWWCALARVALGSVYIYTLLGWRGCGLGMI